MNLGPQDARHSSASLALGSGRVGAGLPGRAPARTVLAGAIIAALVAVGCNQAVSPGTSATAHRASSHDEFVTAAGVLEAWQVLVASAGSIELPPGASPRPCPNVAIQL